MLWKHRAPARLNHSHRALAQGLSSTLCCFLATDKALWIVISSQPRRARNFSESSLSLPGMPARRGDPGCSRWRGREWLLQCRVSRCAFHTARGADGRSFSVSGISLQPRAGGPRQGADAALRQDHPGDAGALLRARLAKPNCGRKGESLLGRYPGKQRLYPRGAGAEKLDHSGSAGARRGSFHLHLSPGLSGAAHARTQGAQGIHRLGSRRRLCRRSGVPTRANPRWT